MADKRPLVVVSIAYVAVRLLTTSWTLTRTFDSAAYEGPVSFTGAADRLWLVPLVFRALPDPATIAIQATVSALSFVALAVAVGSTLEHVTARTMVMASILLIGVSPRVVAWDSFALSESLAVSLTVLMLAVVVYWRSMAPAIVVVPVFVAWVFVRDAHAVIGIAIAVPLAVMFWRARRHVAAVLIVGAAFWGIAATQRNQHVEGLNALSFAVFKVAPDVERYAWFVDHGMPMFSRDLVGFELRDALQADASFVEWSEADGARLVARYLIEHPGYTVSAVPKLLQTDPLNGRAAVDRPRLVNVADPTTIPTLPDRTVGLVAVLVSLSLAGFAVARDRRWVWPALLLVSSVPHVVLVYHAVPLELARHALVLTLVLLVSLVWMIGVTVDLLLIRRRSSPRSARSSPKRNRTTTAPL